MKEVEFYIDDQRVDLFSLSDNPIKLNYILLDLQFLDKRGGTVSNIFKVPATKNNNRIFAYYNDIQQKGAENFSKPRKALLIAGGVTVFDGQAIGKAYYGDSAPISYETILKANNLDWSDFLKDLKLVDLSLPTINYDEPTVKASWGHTHADKYVAPLICYGKPYNYNVAWNSGTLLFSPNHAGGNPLKWYYDDFRYWLFAWPIIEEMFRKAGYKIQSNFINNPTPTFDFKKFIVYFNDENVYADLPASVNFKEGKLISADRNCLDFLKGIANLFHLIFYTDTVKKTVYIEPFDTFFTGIASIEDKIDLSQTHKTSQYSDTVKNVFYNWKEDSFGNSYQQYIKNILSTPSPMIPEPALVYDEGFYKGGFRFNNDKEENSYVSYFKGYMTGQLQLDSDFSIYVPFLLDGQVSTVTATGYLGFVQAMHPMPAQAGESDPCFAYYAGLTPMINTGDYTTTAPRFRYHNDTARTDRPFAYICDYIGEEHQNNFHFCDQWNSVWIEELRIAGLYVFPTKLLPGLVSKHMKNFLYSLYYGRSMEVPVQISPLDINSDIQRKHIQFLQTLWVMLEISNYNAASSGSVTCKMLETLVADKPFSDSLVYGGDFTVMYNF